MLGTAWGALYNVMVRGVVVLPDELEAATMYVAVMGGGGTIVEEGAEGVPVTTPVLVLRLRPPGRAGLTL
jgi:hypothetical protein